MLWFSVPYSDSFVSRVALRGARTTGGDGERSSRPPPLPLPTPPLAERLCVLPLRPADAPTRLMVGGLCPPLPAFLLQRAFAPRLVTRRLPPAFPLSPPPSPSPQSSPSPLPPAPRPSERALRSARSARSFRRFAAAAARARALAESAARTSIWIRSLASVRVLSLVAMAWRCRSLPIQSVEPRSTLVNLWRCSLLEALVGERPSLVADEDEEDEEEEEEEVEEDEEEEGSNEDEDEANVWHDAPGQIKRWLARSTSASASRATARHHRARSRRYGTRAPGVRPTALDLA